MTPFWRVAVREIGLAVLANAALLAVIFGIVSWVNAQPPQATDRMAVLQQRVQDLADYREFLETQLAASKVLIAELQKRLAACNASPTAAP